MTTNSSDPVTLPTAIHLLLTAGCTYAQAPAWRTANSKVQLVKVKNVRPFLGWVHADGTIDPWGAMTETDMQGVFVTDASPEVISKVELEEGTLPWAMNELLKGEVVKFLGKPLTIQEVVGPNGLMYSLNLPNGEAKNFRFAPKDFYTVFEAGGSFKTLTHVQCAVLTHYVDENNKAMMVAVLARMVYGAECLEAYRLIEVDSLSTNQSEIDKASNDLYELAMEQAKKVYSPQDMGRIRSAISGEFES